MSFRRSIIVAVMSLAGAALLLPQVASWAQGPSNHREVFLVRQDQSDCTNTTVPNSNTDPGDLGILEIFRGDDGNTTVKVAMTVSPNTTYHFFLKCVRQLGDITTGDEGVGTAIFTFPTNATGPIYAFDMYPEGAPPGNKFQSVTVSF
jgi:hypothetical protein